MYFHAHEAYNISELEATDYCNGLDPSLVGSFRVVIPIGKVDFDFWLFDSSFDTFLHLINTTGTHTNKQTRHNKAQNHRDKQNITKQKKGSQNTAKSNNKQRQSGPLRIQNPP